MRELAELVAEITGATIDHVDNPRNEAAENELFVEAKGSGRARVETHAARTRLARGSG